MTTQLMETPAYTLVKTLDDSQILDLQDMVRKEWWTRDRDLDDIERMLAKCDLIHGVVDPQTGELLAFCRALIDGVFKAVLFDVIVAEKSRNAGLGRILMDSLMERPELRGIAHIELYCKPGVAEFYQKWGFADDGQRLTLMRREGKPS